MTARDDYVGHNRPARGAEAVTPSDSAELTYVSRAIYVGGEGNITLVTYDNQTVLFSALPAGTVLPIQARQIKSTGTTATLLVSMY